VSVPPAATTGTDGTSERQGIAVSSGVKLRVPPDLATVIPAWPKLPTVARGSAGDGEGGRRPRKTAESPTGCAGKRRSEEGPIMVPRRSLLATA